MWVCSVFCFGLAPHSPIACGVIRDPGRDTETAVRSFILKLENQMVQKFCDYTEEEQFSLVSFRSLVLQNKKP